MIDFNSLQPKTKLYRWENNFYTTYEIISINRETKTARCRYHIGDSLVTGPVNKELLAQLHRAPPRIKNGC